MSTLTTYNEGFAFTQEQIKIIKSQIAKGATDDELKMFTTIAEKYGLDPFLKEIWFIKSVKKIKKGKDNFGNDIWDYPRLADGTVDYSKAETLIFTSRDGYLKVAQRDPNFTGLLSMAVCEGDSFEIDAENYRVSHKFGAKRGKLIGAWSKVDRAGRKPVITYIPIEEYRSEKSTVWKQYPTAMIIKVAEVLALKRQFGISGLVTKEEMSHTLDDIPQDIIEAEIIEEPKPQPKPQTNSQLSDKQIQRLFTIAKNAQLSDDDIHTWINGRFKKTSVKELTTTEYNQLCDALEKYKSNLGGNK
jgi:phage recombination protein Bet